MHPLLSLNATAYRVGKGIKTRKGKKLCMSFSVFNKIEYKFDLSTFYVQTIQCVYRTVVTVFVSLALTIGDKFIDRALSYLTILF